MKIKKEKILFFTRELKIMLKGGITFIKAIELIGNEEKNNDFKKILKKISKNLSSGKNIYDSFKIYKDIFGENYIQMIKIGELSGTLTERLEDIIELFESEISNKKKILSMLTYPIVVIIFTISVVIFLLLFILPNFISIFEENNVELPFLTKILLSISQNFTWILFFIILIIVGLHFIKVYINRNKKRKLKKDKFLFKIIIFGDLLRLSTAERIYYSLYTLLNVGIGLVESIDIIYTNTNNSYVKANLLEVKKSILDGSSISKALKNLNLYTDRFSTLFISGEESGYFLENLLQVSKILKQDFEYKLKKLISFIEPLVIIILGVIVGLIVCAIYLPILSLGNVFN